MHAEICAGGGPTPSAKGRPYRDRLSDRRRPRRLTKSAASAVSGPRTRALHWWNRRSLPRRDSLSRTSCVPPVWLCSLEDAEQQASSRPAVPKHISDRERDELMLAQTRAEGHRVQAVVSETSSVLAGDLEQGSLLAFDQGAWGAC